MTAEYCSPEGVRTIVNLPVLRSIDEVGFGSGIFQLLPRKLLFTVGVHAGLKLGSETGSKGVAGKGGAAKGVPAPWR
jgi:hypothetical protein